MATLRASRSRRRSAAHDQAITEHDIKVLEATLEEGDTIGHSLLEEMRAGRTHSEAEIAAIYGVSLDDEPAAR